MVFVQAHAVEAQPVGQFHLVEIIVIKLGAELRIIMGIGQRDPGRSVALDGIEIDVPVRHKMEVEKLHGPVSSRERIAGFLLLPTA